MSTSTGDAYLKRIVIDNHVYTVDGEVANELLRLNNIIDKMQKKVETMERQANENATKMTELIMGNLFTDGGSRNNSVMKHSMNYFERTDIHGEPILSYRDDVYKRVFLGIRGEKYSASCTIDKV